MARAALALSVAVCLAAGVAGQAMLKAFDAEADCSRGKSPVATFVSPTAPSSLLGRCGEDMLMEHSTALGTKLVRLRQVCEAGKPYRLHTCDLEEDMPCASTPASFPFKADGIVAFKGGDCVQAEGNGLWYKRGEPVVLHRFREGSNCEGQPVVSLSLAALMACDRCNKVVAQGLNESTGVGMPAYVGAKCTEAGIQLSLHELAKDCADGLPAKNPADQIQIPRDEMPMWELAGRCAQSDKRVGWRIDVPSAFYEEMGASSSLLEQVEQAGPADQVRTVSGDARWGDAGSIPASWSSFSRTATEASAIATAATPVALAALGFALAL